MDELHKLTKVIVRSMKSFSYIALLLMMFMTIYSILGVQLFSGALGKVAMPMLA